MVYCYDGINNISIYINGILKSSGNISAPLNIGLSTLRFGKGIACHENWNFEGLLDDIRIYNHALSASEIDSLYREGGYNAVPATPQNLTAQPTANSQQLLLKWNSISDTDLRAYKISYGTSSGNYTLSDSTTQRLDTTKIISGLTNGTTYYFKVTAIDSSNQQSSASNEAVATPYQLVTGEYSADTNTVLLMHFSETAGQFVQDVSGKNNNGTATGTTIVNGRFGKARSFNGTSDYVAIIHDNSLNLDRKLSVESWIQISSLPPDIAAVVVKRILNPSVENYGLYILPSSGKIRFQFSINQSLTKYIDSDIGIVDGKKHHICGNYNGQYINIFIDGKLAGQVAEVGLPDTNTEPIIIGKKNDPSYPYYYGGIIDEVRISKIARDPSEFNL